MRNASLLRTALALAGALQAGGTSPDGTTALIWAAHQNDLAAVERLLAAHADPRPANAYGATALLEAAAHANAPMMERLLKAGADPNQATPEGRTPLMTAARSGSAEAVHLLLTHGSAVDARESWKSQTALMWAAAANHAAVVEALLNGGASANAHSKAWPLKPKKKEDGNLVSNPPRGGLTPLLYASRHGALDAARALVAGGADVNLADPDDVAPVVMALINAHYDLAAFLLGAGADPNLADRWGRNALYAAIEMHTLEPSVTRPSPKTSDAATGLDVASIALERGGKPDAALVEPTPGRGVSDFPDPVLRAGATAFIRAAKTGDVAGMRLLLNHGANPKAATAQQITALMVAAGMGWRYGDSVVPEAVSLEAVKLCLELGLDPNQANEKGRTALHGAAERGANEIAELLVSQGARLEVKDADGRTALDIAKGNGGRGNPEYPKTVELLKRLALAR